MSVTNMGRQLLRHVCGRIKLLTNKGELCTALRAGTNLKALGQRIDWAMDLHITHKRSSHWSAVYTGSKVHVAKTVDLHTYRSVAKASLCEAGRKLGTP